jgi:hypothetical protein
MLPQIFRTEDVLLEIEFPVNDRLPLERLLANLPSETFMADDSLGWVYQFWQTKKKDEVNAAEVKIGARELPAVTQLFTEPYMVAFLLDNSLGAWWAARRLTEADFKHAENEDVLRTKAALPGVPLTYLRFVKQDDGTWTPAAGTFDGWPDHLGELKAIDPCCGSGHFLGAALLMLVPMRMELEGLAAHEAVDAVLRENLHGLELDQRCVELAAFALALTAWRYPGAGGYRQLPELHIACSGLSVSAAKEEWRQLAMDRHNLRLALEWMYEVFQDAPVLGSLLNPAKTDAARLVQWEELSRALGQALTQEQTDEQREAGVVAQGLAKAAQLLAGQYHWVITNVPYLVRGKQGNTLRDFCDKHYPAAKNDLATVFLDRCLHLCLEKGTVSLVLPQNWLFQISYRKFREKMLQNDTWHLIAWLGAGAFETISGEVVKPILLTLSRGQSGSGFQPVFHANRNLESSPTIVGLDVSASRTAAEKAAQLMTTKMRSVDQAKQLENPDARVVLEETSNTSLLEQYAVALAGINTGDYPRWGRKFWELQEITDEWELQQTTTLQTAYDSGLTQIVKWCGGSGEYLAYIQELNGRLGGSWKRGMDVWGKSGVAVSQMSNLPVARYAGSAFDSNVSAIVPNNQSNVPAIFAFCSSEGFVQEIRRIDRKLNVTNATLAKVPFDLDYWTKVAQGKYPNGLPKPYSDDPTQWIFHGHPAQSDSPLQVAVARLLGYRWPAEQDSAMELSDDARAWVKKSEGLLVHADKDGIVCLPAVRGELPAAERLLEVLHVAYGSSWSTAVLNQLLTETGCKSGTTLDEWLRNSFFEQHYKLFHHRPFIWHLWDGRRDGFACLVNYHKLDYKLLENLTYSYLQDWINTQTAAARENKTGADLRLKAAQDLQDKLKLILAGEPPYDIFIRWKPIEAQPLGWHPDLNDGVRLNIRPFVTAGVLRKNPNITWTKDRGQDPASTPWFPIFKGERINDYHLTIA